MAKRTNPDEKRKLNKGEWAELYVLLKLLGEGRIYTANELLQRNAQSYLNILNVLRQEPDSDVLEYIVNDNETVSVKNQTTCDTLVTINRKDFLKAAEVLLEDITYKTGASIAASDEVYDFSHKIYVNQPKAAAVKSLSKQFGGKNDIFITILDPQTSIKSLMGFSIKSRYSKNPPTLFNAGPTSQFKFELSNCNNELMDEFNTILDEQGHRDWKGCKAFLKRHNIELNLVSTLHDIYEENLVLVRDRMPEILGWCVKDRLLNAEKEEDYGVMETVSRLSSDNPLRVNRPEVYYEKAIKDLLMAGFSGMTAGQIWDGKEQVNGGYIVVMESGDVLCYHSTDRESFRRYLFRNTHFEYVGTNKYHWSYIKPEGDKFYLPLNISIRFNKSVR